MKTFVTHRSYSHEILTALYLSRAPYLFFWRRLHGLLEIVCQSSSYCYFYCIKSVIVTEDPSEISAHLRVPESNSLIVSLCFTNRIRVQWCDSWLCKKYFAYKAIDNQYVRCAEEHIHDLITKKRRIKLLRIDCQGWRGGVSNFIGDRFWDSVLSGASCLV